MKSYGTYIDGNIMAGKLPGVKVQPVVGNFHLVAVNDFLLDDAVAVAETVAPGWVVKGCQAVKEAGCQAAETAIAQSGVVLLLDNVLDPKAKIGKTGYHPKARLAPHQYPAWLEWVVQHTLRSVLEAYIEYGVVEGTAHEKLQAEVVDTLVIAVRVALLRLVPIGNEAVAEGEASGGVGGLFVAVEQAAGQSSLDMTDDFALKPVRVFKILDRVAVPCFALGFRDRG